jgi:uncharacterized protein (TIRG00374 family)
MPIRSLQVRGWFIRAVISVLLIAWLLQRVDVTSAWSTIHKLDLQLYFTLMCLQALAIVISAAKWRLLLPHRSLGTLIALSLIGQFYSLVLPGQFLGEAMKAYRLGQGSRDAEQVAASVVVDKITGILALILLGFLGLYAARPGVPAPIIDSLFVAFLCGLAALFALRWGAFYKVLQRLISRIEQRIPLLHGLFYRLRFILLEWRRYAERPGILLVSLVMGLLFQGVALAILILVSWQYGIMLSPFAWLWIFALVSLAVLLPLSIGGIGVREGAFVGLLALFDIGTSAALALSLTVFSLQLVAAAVGLIVEFGRSSRR